MLTYRRIFAVIVSGLFFYVASPLFIPITMGGILAALFTPALKRLERRNLSRPICSGIMTFGITVVLLLPVSFLIFFSVKSAFIQLQAWRTARTLGGGLTESLLSTPSIHRFMLWITSKVPINMQDLENTFQDFVATIGTRLTEFLGGTLTHLPGMLGGLLLVIVSVYFFLVDGPKLILFVRRNTVFSPPQTDHLIHTVAEMCRSVILASLVSGVVQSLLEVLACVVTGTSNAVLIGLLVFIGSFIPLIGCFPITLVVGLQQLFEGHQTAGITLLIASFIILGVDGMVRPLFLRGSANLHPFLGFVAAFGGLQTMGFLGVFVGPILATLCVATIHILTQDDNEVLVEV